MERIRLENDDPELKCEFTNSKKHGWNTDRTLLNAMIFRTWKIKHILENFFYNFFLQFLVTRLISIIRIKVAWTKNYISISIIQMILLQILFGGFKNL